MKFSELTLDMFRMLQALEREPQEAPLHTLVTSTEGSESPIDGVSHIDVLCSPFRFSKYLRENRSPCQ